MNRLLCALLLIAPVFAQDGRQIFEESQKRSRSQSQRYEGTLEVFGPEQRKSVKRWTYQRLGSSGESKILVRFTEPAEVKGLALLIVNHPGRAADQWMWTPAIGRERRIAAQDRSTRFFGTGFTFEDLEERDARQFDFQLQGSETLDGAPCWKIESKPKPGTISQYSSSLICIRKDNYVAAQVENFSQGKMIRRIKNSGIEKVDGIWTPRSVEVFDAGLNSRTLLMLDKVHFNGPMKEEDFTVEALRRD